MKINKNINGLKDMKINKNIKGLKDMEIYNNKKWKQIIIWK